MEWAVLRLFKIIDGGCSCRFGKKCSQKQGKHPAMEHGKDDATTDLSLLTSLFAEDKWNIGIKYGEESHLTVLDIDPRHGGMESLKELRKFPGNWENTLIASTGSMGFHYYFDFCADVPQRRNVLPGVDIINEGGYVVACPSNHLSGKFYSWLNGNPGKI